MIKLISTRGHSARSRGGRRTIRKDPEMTDGLDLGLHGEEDSPDDSQGEPERVEGLTGQAASCEG